MVTLTKHQILWAVAMGMIRVDLREPYHRGDSAFTYRLNGEELDFGSTRKFEDLEDERYIGGVTIFELELTDKGKEAL